MKRVLVVLCLLMLLASSSVQAQDPTPEAEPEQNPIFFFLPILVQYFTPPKYILVEDYADLKAWFESYGIEVPDAAPDVEASETREFLLGCDLGEGAYVAFRVGPGAMRSIFSVAGVLPGEDGTRVDSTCPTNSCMGGHLWSGDEGKRVLSHFLFGLLDAAHLFGGCF